jgi:hypothetical protein
MTKNINYRLRMLKNEELRKEIFGLKREKSSGGWRHNGL